MFRPFRSSRTGLTSPRAGMNPPADRFVLVQVPRGGGRSMVSSLVSESSSFMQFAARHGRTAGAALALVLSLGGCSRPAQQAGAPATQVDAPTAAAIPPPTAAQAPLPPGPVPATFDVAGLAEQV